MDASSNTGMLVHKFGLALAEIDIDEAIKKYKKPMTASPLTRD
jgi:hypothetical protein